MRRHASHNTDETNFHGLFLLIFRDDLTIKISATLALQENKSPIP